LNDDDDDNKDDEDDDDDDDQCDYEYVRDKLSKHLLSFAYDMLCYDMIWYAI
jgi:hypothetical protein